MTGQDTEGGSPAPGHLPSSASLRPREAFSGPRAAPIRVGVWFWEPGSPTWGSEETLLLSEEVCRPFSVGQMSVFASRKKWLCFSFY